MSAHHTPTDTTFRHSEHIENTDSPARRVSYINQELAIPEKAESIDDDDRARDAENMDTMRRVSFIDQELAVPEEGGPIHDDGPDEENFQGS